VFSHVSFTRWVGVRVKYHAFVRFRTEHRVPPRGRRGEDMAYPKFSVSHVTYPGSVRVNTRPANKIRRAPSHRRGLSTLRQNHGSQGFESERRERAWSVSYCKGLPKDRHERKSDVIPHLPNDSLQLPRLTPIESRYFHSAHLAKTRKGGEQDLRRTVVNLASCNISSHDGIYEQIVSAHLVTTQRRVPRNLASPKSSCRASDKQHGSPDSDLQVTASREEAGLKGFRFPTPEHPDGLPTPELPLAQPNPHLPCMLSYETAKEASVGGCGSLGQNKATTFLGAGADIVTVQCGRQPHVSGIFNKTSATFVPSLSYLIDDTNAMSGIIRKRPPSSGGTETEPGSCEISGRYCHAFKPTDDLQRRNNGSLMP